MSASAQDELIDLTSSEVLFKDDKAFIEYWQFDREGDDWLLQKINQSEIASSLEKGYMIKTDREAITAEAVQMQDFATRNNFFYNADFGWLLMPNKGELFTLANFGRSDINYHVIGTYKDVLVQFYQYIPVIQAKRNFTDYIKAWYKAAYRYDQYLVAQTILPRSYGNIVVKYNSATGIVFKPKGLQEIVLEGVDFGKFYSVYASDQDKVNSLELLNPRYMATLIDLPFEVNIEIVDNVLYLYSTDNNANFDTMLTLIQNAFLEMKM